MFRPSAPQTQRAFSLVELAVALAVAAILVGMAAPSFRDMVRRNVADGALYDLLGDLQFARSEAIRRGTRVTICAAAADGGCGTGWDAGRVVFVDDAAPGTGGTVGGLDAGELVLRRAGPLDDALDLGARARTAPNAAAATAVGFARFGPRGTSSWRGGGHFALRPSPCEDASEVDGLVVSMSGDVRRARRDGDGLATGAFGAPIGCPVAASS